MLTVFRFESAGIGFHKCCKTNETRRTKKDRENEDRLRSRLFPETGKSLRIVSEKGMLDSRKGLLVCVYKKMETERRFNKDCCAAACKPVLARNFFRIITAKVC